jgi:aspartate 1-decarboxylase
MLVNLLKSKIHRATITDANLNYNGSLTVDEELMEKANLIEYEQVSVVNVNNGARFETYLIKGKRGNRDICLNGAAARLGQVGDKVIIMAYCQIENSKIPNPYNPTVILVDDKNNLQT